MDTLQIRNRFLGVIVSAAGVSLVVQMLAFLRQVLIAAYFGISRDVDVYVMIYSLAMFLVFTFSGIFESIAVPHLVRRREAEGEASMRLLAVEILRLSVGLGVVASALMLVAVPLLTPVIATGFSPAERAELASLAWYFLPWTLLALPYYAAAARHKAEWRFARVFGSEIVVVVMSVGVLLIWHSDIRTLPLAYAAGYGAGFLQLMYGAGLWRRDRTRPRPAIRDVFRNIGELYLANQIGSISGIIDRHIQSFVPPGGVAAINYSSQLILSLASLLTFREIFIVPLSQQADRAQKLERLLSGVVLLAVPLSGVVACFAPDIVAVMFERGRFDATATALTSEVLRISAFSIVLGGILTPLARMFQIVDRIAFTQLMYGWIAVSILMFGYLFVIHLQWGVRGVAVAQIASSATTCALTAYLVSRCGIALRWRRIFGYLGFAAGAAGLAYLVAAAAATQVAGAWSRLLVGGPAYGSVIALFFFLARSHLYGIAFGVERPANRP